MTRKQAYRAQRAAWRQALQDGRVLRHPVGDSLTSYPTIAMRDAAMARDPLLQIVEIGKEGTSIMR